MKNPILFLGLLLMMGSLQAQHSVSGKIADSQGAPLIGVSIQEKNAATGAVSDLDGTYSIRCSNPNATLIFSYVGFGTQEIPVNGRTEIDVVLETDYRILDQIVITGSRRSNRTVRSPRS